MFEADQQVKGSEMFDKNQTVMSGWLNISNMAGLVGVPAQEPARLILIHRTSAEEIHAALTERGQNIQCSPPAGYGDA